MRKILLVCSAGMSTSIIAKKMQAVAEKQNVSVDIWFVAEAMAMENIEKADVVMLGPQVSHLYDKIKKFAGEKPVEIIHRKDYGMMNGERILNQALDALKKYQYTAK